jgi:hypothetical protein
MSFEILLNVTTGPIEAFILPLQMTQHQASFEGAGNQCGDLHRIESGANLPGAIFEYAPGSRPRSGLAKLSSIGLLVPRIAAFARPRSASSWSAPSYPCDAPSGLGARVPVVVLALRFAVGTRALRKLEDSRHPLDGRYQRRRTFPRTCTTERTLPASMANSNKCLTPFIMKPYSYSLCVTAQLQTSQRLPSAPSPIPLVAPCLTSCGREAYRPDGSLRPSPSPARLFRNTCACCAERISCKSAVTVGTAFTG